jgi:hypothetical protein
MREPVRNELINSTWLPAKIMPGVVLTLKWQTFSNRDSLAIHTLADHGEIFVTIYK